ncbi:MAG: hypothetical protein WD489_09720 [Rhodovibrionaceae bacterium]
MRKIMQKVVILGAWASGTSAMAGILERMGFYTCPSHWITYDERTPISYEPNALRDIVLPCMEEAKLAYKPGLDRKALQGRLAAWSREEEEKAQQGGWRGLAIKLPHLAFFLPEVSEAWKPDFLVVTRRLADIETTRRRRAWQPYLGSEGAKAIYSKLFGDLLALQRGYLTVAFEELRGAPEPQIERISSFLDLDPASYDRGKVLSWVRR